jgi:hypothetical protein
MDWAKLVFLTLPFVFSIHVNKTTNFKQQPLPIKAKENKSPEKITKPNQIISNLSKYRVSRGFSKL